MQFSTSFYRQLSEHAYSIHGGIFLRPFRIHRAQRTSALRLVVIIKRLALLVYYLNRGVMFTIMYRINEHKHKPNVVEYETYNLFF